ncbi:IS5/IS1182 family transposase [Desulfonema ishimotonii]|uniref:IS5/IS1182 family transposase n=1 Tax=Desulfonema ishimotonii TaxID=45657 RepID=A0A401FTG6_9BACT|nr:transposase family protein [Desulfonema ishimotonii]GBC60256.1 IS5/IS1182 family transposase [Desulfonema ishimotonii]
MLTYEKLSRKPGTFRRLTGVSVGVFSEMAGKIGPLWEKRRNNYEKGGRNHALPGVENHLPAMLIYYRCYVTYEFMGFFFDCDETTAMRAVKRIEKMAIRVIRIEKKRGISASDTEYLIPDATEQPVQRPKRKQRKSYSGKKKGHTQKTQYITDPAGRIRAVSRTYPGKTHDFTIYKKQKKRDRFCGVPKKADNGYQGIRKYDKNAEIPYKKPRGGELTAEQKDFNRRLSKKRIRVGNTIREIKIFKIMSDTYRNRRKNHNLRANIIAGMVNMKITERELRKAA